MRIAALYDIHGNLPALEAVLAAARRERVDQIVVGGDVFPGPQSSRVLEVLLALDLPVQYLRGNGDREILALAAGEEPAALPERYRAAMRWEAERLSAEHRRIVAAWPGLLQLGDVCFCHATPHSDSAIFTRLTPEERLLPVFDGSGASTVVCGHTHMQFDRKVGTVRVINAGSVGMPFGAAGAYWLLLGREPELRRTDYDLAAAAARIRACGHPGAEEFAARYVLNPPTEQEMLAAFAPAGP
ncbi:MAG TPA: metallophosphoesterase family protein [Candidatus Polarisedimenticolaceae bacterium]|nr:metallophosphoesterase family protein [Candidatus Polarisedimenticolaceae bacterium]